MRGTPWVVFDGKIGMGVCQRCGEKLNLPLPQPVCVFVAATKAFCKMHKNCRETDSYREKTAVNAQDKEFF
jgi:hypothetical protein